jgi:hypothetical protein
VSEKPVMKVAAAGLTPMSPVMADAGTLEIPLLARMAKSRAAPRSTASPGSMGLPVSVEPSPSVGLVSPVASSVSAGFVAPVASSVSAEPVSVGSPLAISSDEPSAGSPQAAPSASSTAASVAFASFDFIVIIDSMGVFMIDPRYRVGAHTVPRVSRNE